VDKRDQYLTAVHNLNVYRQGDRRAPHKPLLLLFAISKLVAGERSVPFGEVEEALMPLLDAYAPAVKSRHQPELPYWHLCSDGVWQVEGAEALPLQAGGFPRMHALRQTTGQLDAGFADYLKSDESFLSSVVDLVLEDHFPESLHGDILEAVGLTLPEEEQAAADVPSSSLRKPRDPKFSIQVLRAYEHRCAVTGFRAALGGRYFGCEAAHVQWHAYGGPDSLENGIALEPTIHKLFDAGAWTLSDERQILVSSELTGTDEAVSRVRALHGAELRPPLTGEPEVSTAFIRWHREPDLGAVFRHPALSL